jgi:hypothetical protein
MVEYWLKRRALRILPTKTLGGLARFVFLDRLESGFTNAGTGDSLLNTLCNAPSSAIRSSIQNQDLHYVGGLISY